MLTLETITKNWNELLETCAKQNQLTHISRTQFLNQLLPVQLTNDTLYLYISSKEQSSELMADFLEKRFSKMLTESLKDRFQKELTLKFVTSVPDKLDNALRDSTFETDSKSPDTASELSLCLDISDPEGCLSFLDCCELLQQIEDTLTRLQKPDTARLTFSYASPKIKNKEY